MFPLRQTRPCLALPPGSAHPSPSSCGNFQTFQHSNLSTFRQPIRSSLATAPLTPFPATLSGESQLIENPAALSPVLATLTRHLHLNPFVCHSYKKHPGGGYTLQPAISFRNLTTRHSPLTTKSFAIRSSIKPAHKLFRMNTSKKPGGGTHHRRHSPTTHCSLLTTHFFLWNPQDSVLFQLRASGQLLQLFQAAHAPACEDRQKAQLARLQHFVWIQKRFEILLMRGHQSRFQRLHLASLAPQFL